MEYTQRTVDDTILGSERLNMIKAGEIGVFLAVVANPINTSRYGRNQELGSFLLIGDRGTEDSPASIVISTRRTGHLSIRLVYRTKENVKMEVELSPQMNGSAFSSIPRHLVVPVRRNLPLLLQALHNLFPQVEDEVEFYSKVANS